MAASFALYYQLNRQSQPQVARECLATAEEVYGLAGTSIADPAYLLTAVPVDGYPETVWEDDMEWGATELAMALATAQADEGDVGGLAVTDPAVYLRDATK